MTTRPLALTVLLLVLAACGGGEPTATPSSRAPSTGSPATSDAAEPADGPAEVLPAFPRHPARQTGDPSGEWDLVLRDVRVSDHARFDRVVLEFTGTGSPGWSVDYVDRAVLDGSGENVTLGGRAILDIYASGTTWPAPGYYSGPPRLEPAPGGGIAELYVGGTFEGFTQVLAGIGGNPVPFRVFALSSPTRLVVDVLGRG